MAKVSNLKIKLQTGSDNTYFATWTFATNKAVSTSVKVGSWVTIKSGATYYNGVSIPSWVFNETWYVTQINGDRAVLGKSKSGTYDIQSPISTRYLSGGSSSSPGVGSGTLDHYEVSWDYDTGNSIWFSGNSSSNVTVTHATYSPPNNALRIRVKVKPVSKTYKVTRTINVSSGSGDNGNKYNLPNYKSNSSSKTTTKTTTTEMPYWTGTYVTKVYTLPKESSKPPEKPSAPSVEIKDQKLTATLEGITDARADEIYFYVYKQINKRIYKSARVPVRQQRASYSVTVEAGYNYVVRCVAVNRYSTKRLKSEWSDYSSPVGTRPKAIKAIKTLKALSETEVQLSWNGISTATSYEIQYTTEKRYFDSSDEVTSKSIKAPTTHAEITGLTSGDEYFFRLRAVNDKGETAWTPIKSIKIGKAPSAPTTWSSTTTVTIGTDVILYWVHNTEDGSAETGAQVETIIHGKKTTMTIPPPPNTDSENQTYSCTINTSGYTEGTKILWRVRTKGITNVYGAWSIQRTVDVYAQPTLELNVTDSSGSVIETLNSFPFYISALPGPNTQAPIGYHVEITANESYETVDAIGNKKIVSNGDSLYSNYFEITDSLLIELSAGNIDLENDISYTVACTVSMNSGLTATSESEFTVSWSETSYEPDVGITIDENTLAAYVRPYCADEDGNLIEGVTLSVYRREFDGSFVEIATGLDNTRNTVVTDPHPALDYARYRVVSTVTSTGAVGFYDAPAYPVKEISVVIQWDEEWSDFDHVTGDAMDQPPWTGSMLKLPYNIDVSDKNSRDVSLISYIGRKRPVSYYGTQLGESSTWNVEIEKDDKDTLYALRRLAIYTGDVYVREPSGSGYWANVNVSFSQKHCELTIPVTLELTRVEGGI